MVDKGGDTDLVLLYMCNVQGEERGIAEQSRKQTDRVKTELEQIGFEIWTH